MTTASSTTSASISPTARPSTPPDLDINEICLVGRLSDRAAIIELPSGDRAATWRLVVRRRSRGTRVGSSVDTIDCVSFHKSLIGRAVRWEPGTWLRVTGALHRRFWQTPTGPRSRYQVEAQSAKIEARAPTSPT